MVSPTGPLSLGGQPPGSNIMQLPQLGGMAFAITNTGGWYDTLYFTQPANATAPLDLSGINFHAELRKTVMDSQNMLDLATTNNPPQLINGGASGALFFSVDASLLSALSPFTYVMDMLAIDIATGMTRNLCELEPIAVTVNKGVTR